MNIIEAILLGIIQGLTEFIPVSSSGHLVLADKVFGLGNGSLAFDVALHGGTLAALLVVFHKDVTSLVRGLFAGGEKARLPKYILLATIPAVISGFLLEGLAEDTFRSAVLVAFNLIAVAILMLVAESKFDDKKHTSNLEKTTLKQALTVGFAQAAAVIPGISRSGSTITAGLFMGLDRVAATRFSFLLGMPIIFGALLATLVDGNSISEVQAQPGIFLVGVVVAFLSGLLAIKFLLSYLSKHTLKVFAYYRIAVGILVLLLAL